MINPKRNNRLTVVAGVCVVESAAQMDEVAEVLARLANRLDFDLIFKASYRKANRTSVDAFTGVGDEAALRMIGAIADTYNLTTVTDIHAPTEAAMAAQYCNWLQIPAFLCRQTELLHAAALTGCPILVKKGQFMNPNAMYFVAEKLERFGCRKYMFVERGTTFGYDDLVVDMRSIVRVRRFAPVLVDVTHSTREPAMIEPIALAALAAGADGVFLETHPTPRLALSDGDAACHLDDLEHLLTKLTHLWKALR